MLIFRGIDPGQNPWRYLKRTSSRSSIGQRKRMPESNSFPGGEQTSPLTGNLEIFQNPKGNHGLVISPYIRAKTAHRSCRCNQNLLTISWLQIIFCWSALWPHFLPFKGKKHPPLPLSPPPKKINSSFYWDIKHTLPKKNSRNLEMIWKRNFLSGQVLKPHLVAILCSPFSREKTHLFLTCASRFAQPRFSTLGIWGVQPFVCGDVCLSRFWSPEDWLKPSEISWHLSRPHLKGTNRKILRNWEFLGPLARWELISEIYMALIDGSSSANASRLNARIAPADQLVYPQPSKDKPGGGSTTALATGAVRKARAAPCGHQQELWRENRNVCH